MEGPVKFGIGVLVGTTLLFGGIILWDRQKNTIKGEPMGTRVDIQGNEHIQFNAPHDPYNSNPPTSGPHYAQAAEWGVYEEPLPDEQLIHNLEHGGVNIFYKEDAIDQATVEKLKEIQREFPRKTVLAPRPANEAPIALASWGYYMNLDTFDEQTIREFVLRNKNRAPEFFPD